YKSSVVLSCIQPAGVSGWVEVVRDRMMSSEIRGEVSRAPPRLRWWTAEVDRACVLLLMTTTTGRVSRFTACRSPVACQDGRESFSLPVSASVVMFVQRDQ